MEEVHAFPDASRQNTVQELRKVETGVDLEQPRHAYRSWNVISRRETIIMSEQCCSGRFKGAAIQ